MLLCDAVQWHVHAPLLLAYRGIRWAWPAFSVMLLFSLNLTGFCRKPEPFPCMCQTSSIVHLLEPNSVTYLVPRASGKRWSGIMCIKPLQHDAIMTWLHLCMLHCCKQSTYPLVFLRAKHLSIQTHCTGAAGNSHAGIQVMRQVLPVLQSLSEDGDSTVQAAAIEGLAQLLPLHGSNPELAGRLYSHLDELVTNNQPQVSCIACTALTPLCGTPSCLCWKGMTKQICSRTEGTDSEVPPVVCSTCKQSCVQNVCFMASH